mmetsp:Transcript_36034/g.113202  ORF Transcript_36034/g.113202 Transcript_36034/m.113202 type:complete len:241 (-) Transcript_36034:402-1124(-)
MRLHPGFLVPCEVYVGAMRAAVEARKTAILAELIREGVARACILQLPRRAALQVDDVDLVEEDLVRLLLHVEEVVVEEALVHGGAVERPARPLPARQRLPRDARHAPAGVGAPAPVRLARRAGAPEVRLDDGVAHALVVPAGRREPEVAGVHGRDHAGAEHHAVQPEEGVHAAERHDVRVQKLDSLVLREPPGDVTRDLKSSLSPCMISVYITLTPFSARISSSSGGSFVSGGFPSVALR